MQGVEFNFGLVHQGRARFEESLHWDSTRLFHRDQSKQLNLAVFNVKSFGSEERKMARTLNKPREKMVASSWCGKLLRRRRGQIWLIFLYQMPSFSSMPSFLCWPTHFVYVVVVVVVVKADRQEDSDGAKNLPKLRQLFHLPASLLAPSSS